MVAVVQPPGLSSAHAPGTTGRGCHRWWRHHRLRGCGICRRSRCPRHALRASGRRRRRLRAKHGSGPAPVRLRPCPAVRGDAQHLSRGRAARRGVHVPERGRGAADGDSGFGAPGGGRRRRWVGSALGSPGAAPGAVAGTVARRRPVGHPPGHRIPDSSDGSHRGHGTACSRRGGSIEIGAAAIPAVEHGRTVGVILEGVRPRAADVVLLAAGPWTPYLLDPSGRWQPIVATWGATAQLELASPPRHVVEELRVDSVNQPVNGVGNARRPSAQETPSIFTLAAAGSVVTIGSTFLAFEPDPRAMAPVLVERGKRFLPGLKEARIVATRACARPNRWTGDRWWARSRGSVVCSSPRVTARGASPPVPPRPAWPWTRCSVATEP